MEIQASKLIVSEHGTYEQAFTSAAQEAATTMAALAPAILYRQGSRSYITTSFPLRYIAERVRIDNLSRGGNADEHYNRPLIPEHHRAITDYLISQEDYVLPSLSLCVTEPLHCHIPQSNSVVKMGVVVLPTSIIYNITDGQHRCRAIKDALAQKETLQEDGIGVSIVVEDDLEKIHQLFYDCAQVKPIPASLLTAYNKRDHLARFVREISEQVPVFTGRIEQVSKTVGKSSINLFTLNQLRIGIIDLLTGDATQAGRSLKKDMAQKLEEPEIEDEHKAWVVDFYNNFTMVNKQWSELLVAGNPALGAVDTNSLRQKYVHFTGTGLAVLGRIGFCIRHYPNDERERLIDALGKHIDWSRDAKIWRGNIVINGRMNTQRMPVELAVMRVKEQLRLPFTDREKKRSLRTEQNDG